MLKVHGSHTSAKQTLLSSVPLLDVARQNTPLQSQISAAIAQVSQSGQFIFGPDCTDLEHQIAAYCSVKYGIGCASGSDALLLALMALDIGPGDEVILPSFTFFATASAVTRLGARPVFVDIDPVTFNLDVKRIESAVSAATKVILPVHLFGQPAEMNAILEVAEKHNLKIVEDAAQAIGAKYRNQRVGSIGTIGCLSFYPTKNLGAFGDAGMLLTSDENLTERLRKLRSHGMKPRYHHQEVGINSRLDSIQAAVLNVKLPKLDKWAASRADNAVRYGRLFREAGISEDQIVLPTTSSDCDSVWNQYTIRVQNGQREKLREHLNKLGIGTEVYYPIPLHLQECFRYLGPKTALPETEKAALEVLSLPIFPELAPNEQETVVARIAEFYGKSRLAPLNHLASTPNSASNSHARS